MSHAMLDAGVELAPDVERVIARLFLPGESTPGGNSRTAAVLERVLSLPPDQIEHVAAHIVDRFRHRHPSFLALLHANAAAVAPTQEVTFSEGLSIVLGAMFTAEFAVEGAALCNPSAVPHPDQSRLQHGQLRVLLSLRSIGEPHVSSIQFCEAVIGPGPRWQFVPREKPLHTPVITEGRWTRDQLLRALQHDGGTDELARAVTDALPFEFGSSDIVQAAHELPSTFLHQPDARSQLDWIRVVAGSNYRAAFAETSRLSQRVLLPSAHEEQRGVEDARFVRFVHEDGHADYRATFTAFSGDSIASRLVHTEDFRTFSVQRLTGASARTKGMALFPRRIAGVTFALGRGDGEAISLTRSRDSLDWGPDEPLYRPSRLWELVQSGNCGPPIETAAGWLVLTHGVGPMRTYSIGALLLDLDDPARVLGATKLPLLEPGGPPSDGYVPNVVYGCGAIVHDGILWVPHGVADTRIRVASMPVSSILGLMEPL